MILHVIILPRYNKGAIELDKNGIVVGIESTFADRYLKNRQVDNLQ